MDYFYISPEQFWTWFNRGESECDIMLNKNPRQRQMPSDNQPSNKKPKIVDCRSGSRYDVLYGRQRPGKKHKVWESDGYLSLLDKTAYLSDLKGRLLEEPILLDDDDYDSVLNLKELTIGSHDVQVIELSKK